MGKTVTVEGVTYPSITAAAKKFGAKPKVAWKRLSWGWPPEKAFSPERFNSTPVTFEGVTYPSIAEAALTYDLDPATVAARLRHGWDIQKALTVRPEESIQERGAKEK